VRRLRRLRRAIELRVDRADRDRVRAQAAIDQSSCNKDYSCLKGFCPSFVTVEGGTLRKPPKAEAVDFGSLPEPTLPNAAEPYNILVTGVGGTGVVTIGALLGMAAHLESKGCSVLDMTGLAQKNGAVVSHVRIGDTPEKLYATRIAAGEASLILACDILTSVGNEALAKMQKGVTKALVNTALVMPAQFTREPDLKFPLGSMEQEIKDAVGPATRSFSTRRSSRPPDGRFDRDQSLHGRLRVPARPHPRDRARDHEGDRAQRRGHRVQQARVPMGTAGRRRSREGRRGGDAGQGQARIAAPVGIARRNGRAPFQVPDGVPGHEVRRALYRARGEGARGRSARHAGITELTEAVARYYFKLLAIKDEYEVARLYAETDFVKRVAAQFEGDYQLNFHLAPPVFNKPTR
jgi:indolepyruvate ferredoxin oxidoreductase